MTVFLSTSQKKKKKVQTLEVILQAVRIMGITGQFYHSGIF